MLYDARQRPQAVYLNGKVYIVFNAGGIAGSDASKAQAIPMAITYDPNSRTFSKIVTLSNEKGSRDHHYAPIIWADSKDYLHVLYGCHKTPGTHLISKQPGSIGTSLDDWTVAPQIAPSMSYPNVYSFDNNAKQVLYYRTAEHFSSWTYRVSADDGQTWVNPANDVTDLGMNGEIDWSSYQSKAISRSGNKLHVAFTEYDDNKHDKDPNRFYNPRYNEKLNWKYNVFYVQIDLDNNEVRNYAGKLLSTPIDKNSARANCMIWDTNWAGTETIPTIAVDVNDQPSFLQVYSEKTPTDFGYYYIKYDGGKWKSTRITSATHERNSPHLAVDDDGTLHAYLLIGDGHLDSAGYMDQHGGGNLEEWISTDHGNTWSFKRDLTPDKNKYPLWKFNNPRQIRKTDGTPIDGMFMFYGWKDPKSPEAHAFLLDENEIHEVKLPDKKK